MPHWRPKVFRKCWTIRWMGHICRQFVGTLAKPREKLRPLPELPCEKLKNRCNFLLSLMPLRLHLKKPSSTTARQPQPIPGAFWGHCYLWTDGLHRLRSKDGYCGEVSNGWNERLDVQINRKSQRSVGTSWCLRWLNRDWFEIALAMILLPLRCNIKHWRSHLSKSSFFCSKGGGDYWSIHARLFGTPKIVASQQLKCLYLQGVLCVAKHGMCSVNDYNITTVQKNPNPLFS